MPTDTAEMKDTARTGTVTATPEPEHHQTQAAAGSPQAGAPTSGAPAASRRSGGPAGTSGSSTALGRTGGSALSPFSLLGEPLGTMRSLVDQMNRLFDDFMGYTGSSRSRWPGLSPRGSLGDQSPGVWYPQVEVRERDGNLLVHADLPGMKKEDVQLEIHDDYLALHGERRQEREQNERGLYRSERSYGQFYRTVPLPQGIDPDQAKANFRDGVLEVTIPLPPQAQKQGRRVEIQ
jgi:HSP20 family protein